MYMGQLEHSHSNPLVHALLSVAWDKYDAFAIGGVWGCVVLASNHYDTQDFLEATGYGPVIVGIEHIVFVSTIQQHRQPVRRRCCCKYPQAKLLVVTLRVVWNVALFEVVI